MGGVCWLGFGTSVDVRKAPGSFTCWFLTNREYRIIVVWQIYQPSVAAQRSVWGFMWWHKRAKNSSALSSSSSHQENNMSVHRCWQWGGTYVSSFLFTGQTVSSSPEESVVGCLGVICVHNNIVIPVMNWWLVQGLPRHSHNVSCY